MVGRRSTLYDCAFLALLVLASTSFYLTKLGFYSDDWSLISDFRTSPDRSLVGLVRSVDFSRPVQGIYLISLYRLFGLEPLGYHVANALILAATTILLYLTLCELRQPRLVSFSVALVYGLLPNYSTDRFWFAAFAAPLSIAAYLVSLHADLQSATMRGGKLVMWRLSAIAALLVSTLAYEAALPLFFMNPVLAWYRSRAVQPRDRWSWKRWFLFAGTNAGLLLAIGIYKAETSPRLGARHGILPQMLGIASHLFRGGFNNGDYGLNFRAALTANYGDYLFRLPFVVWSLGRRYPIAWLPAASILLGLTVFLYVIRVADDVEEATANVWRLLIPAGLTVFGFGYGIFLTNGAIQITPTGIGNRTSIAAALGVALVMVGMLGWAVTVLPRLRIRRIVYCGLLSAYVACGFFVISALSSFWTVAYQREREVLTDIQGHFPTLPHDTTFMLGGVCPYVGPAIVFESDWDLAGALRILYRDRSLAADVIRPSSFTIGDTGITTVLYEAEEEWAYGPNLLLYDFRRKVSHQLTDRDTALRIFREAGLDTGHECPPGMEGVGARLF